MFIIYYSIHFRHHCYFFILFMCCGEIVSGGKKAKNTSLISMYVCILYMCYKYINLYVQPNFICILLDQRTRNATPCCGHSKSPEVRQLIWTNSALRRGRFLGSIIWATCAPTKNKKKEKKRSRGGPLAKSMELHWRHLQKLKPSESQWDLFLWMS